MPLTLLSANILMLLAVVFKFTSLPPQIPLFYSRPQGELQLGEWWLIFLIPLLMNGLFLLNTFAYHRFFGENEFVKTFFYYIKLFIIIAFTVIFLRIIFLVT
ncbi:hypothetical protein A3G67_05025 [Candidatus Roizmanbacteria bacterium RIFCSPLOWO2_12_FULL_40_12]|uniref:DUF1648 domain-containing protein n=1 Tax=Candidatus Roizmanbacteria bacterium RIFCSPLOWO2_01_FULL_40_42 TaxID=1802066 RepID=A0A1F7J4G2_9BACT|nr:MAG: hypothetical protein A2779_04125 [Candidatus Roizmanbacteria bacterium RIFCSPHIGHO2_01_FULL_40_98]OGK27265.1 MAG: hypothetical protein A3C31_04450 [Candidatus Roizmanbacteria bacterium RIFCSPHIGHO2_02_FULL_40_53]OGK30863.1 MAG: hypothetical protein A2W49_02590 [Candidatus Roizmanbacteria bacterium RIFCSPHIGHO2_12_41_18]OGK36370.1 MAG: hypothetical protein A3E69_02075 [Candidatus Roizmanbacteria bacterium RIFCSPHIGHO2_12_FULL_40_130]OGK50498.1 MAG: hypothetical protein A3B50_01805 [Candi